MPKRKYDLSSEEEEEAVETGNESEENEPLKAPPKPKVRNIPRPSTTSRDMLIPNPLQGVKTAKKPVIKNDSDEEEDRPAKKKPESTVRIYRPSSYTYPLTVTSRISFFSPRRRKLLQKRRGQYSQMRLVINTSIWERRSGLRYAHSKVSKYFRLQRPGAETRVRCYIRGYTRVL